MRNDSATNVLILQHKHSKGEAPSPYSYTNFEDFITAHLEWLAMLREDNRVAVNKVYTDIFVNRRNSELVAYLSGILHIRKVYGSYLTFGIAKAKKELEIHE